MIVVNKYKLPGEIMIVMKNSIAEGTINTMEFTET